MTLRDFTYIVARLVNVEATRDRWVTAEVLDVAVRGGHCYMELIDKDPAGGQTLAKVRGIIWANAYRVLAAGFYEATGQRFASGLKLMVKVTANFHSVFGMSLVITDINPEYTLGDLLRRRNMMIARLKAEGIFDMNRTLGWPMPALRVAVISAPGAAGYGDFIHQLYTNQARLRFTSRLFRATMQGEKAPESIIAALRRVAMEADKWDVVVIIRGGGSTSDLVSMDNYELAAHVAQFPLPVIVGIGHERDVTILDYVANMRVKTPTAAAELLIAHSGEALARLRTIGSDMLRLASDRIAGSSRQLSFYQGQLPALADNTLVKASGRLQRNAVNLHALASGRVARLRDRLAGLSSMIASAAPAIVSKNLERLRMDSMLLSALSPEATLRRGYSITRVDGHSVTDASSLPLGTIVETTLASGKFTSKVVESSNQS